jgi:holo-[acyl-carrier protein] synthase
MKILANGIDIVEVERIKKTYRKWGDSFLQKVLTKEEIELMKNKKKSFYQSLSARLAAKEATYKAVNGFDKKLKLGWKDLEILNSDNGAPKINFKKKLLSEDTSIILSISHTHNYAIANAIFLKNES